MRGCRCIISIVINIEQGLPSHPRSNEGGQFTAGSKSAALPGAQYLERCFAVKDPLHMTRRAFLALRVIQRQRDLISSEISSGYDWGSVFETFSKISRDT